MNKAVLLAMPKLAATPHMCKAAIENAPILKRWQANFYRCDPIRDCPYKLFLRSSVHNDILQVALFYPSYLAAGAKNPTYIVYVDRAKKEFITYGTERQNWLTGKLDRLDWPTYIGTYPKVFSSRHDEKLIREYLGTKESGYAGLWEFQTDLRNAESSAKYRRLVAPWDADMALTPPLPKDWLHWVDKVGIREHHLFYHYKKGGAKEGYCTYCGKQVTLTKQPYHKGE